MGEFVCPSCFGNSGLQAWVELNRVNLSDYESAKCSYCDEQRDPMVLAETDELCSYIRCCIEARYTDPANELPYESAEGGYQGDTFDAYDVLFELGLELQCGRCDDLLNYIAMSLPDNPWCEKDYFSLPEFDKLTYSWEEFVRVAKDGNVLEFMYGKNPGDSELLAPVAMLEWLLDSAEEFGLIKATEPGKRLFRVRRAFAPGELTTAEDLGPPPAYLAIQPNRMNPAGTSVMYAAEDAVTALVETAVETGLYAIGEFELIDETWLLDLTALPAQICFFDLDNAHMMEAVAFLHSFALSVSEPLLPEADRYVEYRPTQIVTQHFRRHSNNVGASIHGIRYKSSQRDGGINLALFGERIQTCDEPPERGGRFPGVDLCRRAHVQLIAISEEFREIR